MEGIWIEYGCNIDGNMKESGWNMDAYEASWVECGRNMVEFGWDRMNGVWMEYKGIWKENGRNMDAYEGIWAEMDGIWWSANGIC